MIAAVVTIAIIGPLAVAALLYGVVRGVCYVLDAAERREEAC